MVPPDVSGKVIDVVDAGEYTIDDVLVKIEQVNGDVIEIKSYQNGLFVNPYSS